MGRLDLQGASDVPAVPETRSCQNLAPGPTAPRRRAHGLQAWLLGSAGPAQTLIQGLGRSLTTATLKVPAGLLKHPFNKPLLSSSNGQPLRRWE